MPDPILQLRELLTRTPSSDQFLRIIRLISACEDPGQVEFLLDYAEQHLGSWPDHTRAIRIPCPQHPWWRLARSCQLNQNEEDLREYEHITQLLLFMNGASSVRSLDALKHLKSLTLAYTDHLESLNAITTHPTLTDLTFWSVSTADLDWFPPFFKLRRLSIINGNSLQSLQGIMQVPNVQSLELLQCSSLEDIDALANHPSLETLVLKGRFDEMDDYLANNTRYFEHEDNNPYQGLRRSTDLNILQSIPNLKTLELHQSRERSIFMLPSQLEHLSLVQCDFTALLGLETLQNLQTLDLTGTTGVPLEKDEPRLYKNRSEVEVLQKRLKQKRRR